MAKRNIAGQTVAEIYELQKKRKQEWRRPHLGLSGIGHKCERYIWLKFRWAYKGRTETDMRTKRLLETGDREEIRIAGEMKRAGMVLVVKDPKTGQQFEAVDDHLAGHWDGVVTGIPEDPETPHIWECKTHSTKSFDRLLEKGLKASKPEHVAQCQAYMGYSGIHKCLYVAVCKNDDRLYAELIEFDEPAFNNLVSKARLIADAESPPPRQDSKSHPPCVYTSKDGERWPCDFYDLCHAEQMPESNCRTCLDSTPEPDGSWSCRHHKTTLTTQKQRKGCADFMTHPNIPNAMPSVIHDGSVQSIRFIFDSGSQAGGGTRAVGGA